MEEKEKVQEMELKEKKIEDTKVDNVDPEAEFLKELEDEPKKEEEKPKEEKTETEPAKDGEESTETEHEAHEQKIFALRTTANREDQVMDFLVSNAKRKKLEVYSVVRPHGMRSYIFIEAATRSDAEQAAFNIPYARGILPNEIFYHEIEHMLEQVKRELNIQKNDIAEIISGPFKREKCKISRVDQTKEEVVVELLEAAIPIPITLKLDSIKVIRRDEVDDDALDKATRDD